MININKALSITLATLVSMPSIADSLNTEDFSFGGRIEVRGDLVNSDFEDVSRIRLGGQGKHKINDDITAIGKFEFELTQNGDDTIVTNNTRYTYVGAETAYGSLAYGTQNNAVTYMTDFTDMAEYFSGYTNGNIIASGDRATDTLLYSLAKGDFKFNASANLKETEHGGGVMVAYQLLPDIEVSAGYAATEGMNTATDTDYMLAARYTKDGLLLAGLVQTGSLASADFDAVDVFAAYRFGENYVDISYNYYSADDRRDLDIHFVAFEYARYIDDIAAYASYKVALSNDTSAGNDKHANEFVLGARYSF